MRRFSYLILFAAGLSLMLTIGMGARHFFGRHRPSASITTTADSLRPGESATISWETANGSASLDGESVEAVGAKTVSPTETTTYTITCQGKRRRTASDSVEIQVAIDPQPDPQPDPKPEPGPTPDPPTPTPEPIPGTSLSAVGVWSALGAGQKLSEAAHSHDVAELLKSQNGTWTIIDPLMAKEPGHPAWIDQWLDLLQKSGKQAPAVIWHDNGKVLAVDQCGEETTTAALLALAKAQLPKSPDSVTIKGKVHSLGLKKRTSKPGTLKADGKLIPQISALLKPLAEKDYPTCDYRRYFKHVKDQNGYGSCCPTSAASMAEAIRYYWFGDKNVVELSAANLATQIGGWNGAYLSDAMVALTRTGIVPESDQPGYSQRMPSGWKEKARGYRLLAVYDSPSDDPLGYLAAALSRGWPVHIGISVGGGFDADSDGYISYARGSGGGGHAVVACGLKKSGGKWWILILNSWGRNWGQDGFAWIESTFITRTQFYDLWVGVVPTASPSDSVSPPHVAKTARPLLLDAVKQAAKSAEQPPKQEAAEPVKQRPSSPCEGGKCGSGGGQFWTKFHKSKTAAKRR